VLSSTLLALALITASPSASEPIIHQDFADPIDALSVEFLDDDVSVEVSGWNGSRWTEWQPLMLENEQDPLLKESNLIMFPDAVSKIRVRGAAGIALHPIRVAKDPARYTVASHEAIGKPRIYSRAEWGADESLLIAKDEPEPAEEEKDSNGNTGATEEPSNRVQDCEEAQKLYPKEFKSVGRATTNKDGERLRWTQEYSPNIRLLVVHHTALKVTGDARPPLERIRALYQYHVQNRGWGDVGYHYLIDEEGQIYEGRAGGERVVGGHVYCNNVGTIGVALLGNFDVEKPTQDQMRSLQWLLSDLGNRYDVEPGRTTVFHGKTLPTVVGHKDLISTDCPGYYVKETLGQVRRNVASGNIDATIKFPQITKRTVNVLTKKVSPVQKAREERITRRSATLSRKIRAAERLRERSGNSRTVPVGTNVQRQRSTPQKPIRPTGTKENPAESSVGARRAVPLHDNAMIRIRLTKQEASVASCASFDAALFETKFRGTMECLTLGGKPALINELSLEDYMAGLAEEPDTEPWEKQRAFAIAARTYAAFYMDPKNRKFPGMPYDGSDDPAFFQAYGGITFENRNPRWVESVRDTENLVLTKNNQIIKAPYFSTDNGRTRTPAEAGWKDFPFPEIFESKADPWCAGMKLWGHGVGMSGCGAGGQAREGKIAEEILRYYYPGTRILDVTTVRH